MHNVCQFLLREGGTCCVKGLGSRLTVSLKPTPQCCVQSDWGDLELAKPHIIGASPHTITMTVTTFPLSACSDRSSLMHCRVTTMMPNCSANCTVCYEIHRSFAQLTTSSESIHHGIICSEASLAMRTNMLYVHATQTGKKKKKDQETYQLSYRYQIQRRRLVSLCMPALVVATVHASYSAPPIDMVCSEYRFDTTM